MSPEDLVAIEEIRALKARYFRYMDTKAWDASSPIRSLHGFGHYHDRYEKLDGRWCISSTKLTRLRVDVEMADDH